MACPLNPGKPLTGNNVIAYYLLILPAKRIANKNELAVDYYSSFNPKSTELFAPETALGVFSTIRLDPDIPEGWNFHGW